MALTLDRSSVRMRFLKDGAIASCHTGTKRALLHCTANANLAAGDTEPPKDVVKDNAIQVEASVFVASTANEFDVGDMQFGMVQTTEISFYQFLYAGKRNAEGSCLADMRQGFQVNPSLDVRQRTRPAIDDFIFQNTIIDRVTGPRPGFNVACRFGDHPNSVIPYRFENSRTGARNFLALAARLQKFEVFFLQRDSAAATPVVLGKFDWAVAWVVEFSWSLRSSVPTANIRRAELLDGIFRPVVAATERTASIAINRTLPTTKKQDDDAVNTIWTLRRRPLLTQSSTWPPEFRSDFFS